MSGTAWSDAELKKLETANKNRAPWETDMELAVKIANSFKFRSIESIRWQLRQFPVKERGVSSPKILLLDIETLPIEAYVWGVWNQNVYPDQIKKDWSIVCWAAKWLFDKKVYGQSVTPKEAIAHEDKSIMGGIWEMMNEADVVIAHNGFGFDFKKLNTRFLVNGLPKPMYSYGVDTLKIAKDEFDFTFNKMDWINKVLGINRKMDTSFRWWSECAAGNEKYLGLMSKYNKQDTFILEELYLKLRPWMKAHPNMNLYNSDKSVAVCPTCSSVNIKWEGRYSTPLGLYKAFRCHDCGAIGRSTLKKYQINRAKARN